VWRLSLPEVLFIGEGRGRGGRSSPTLLSTFEGSENSIQTVAASEAIALQGCHAPPYALVRRSRGGGSERGGLTEDVEGAKEAHDDDDDPVGGAVLREPGEGEGQGEKGGKGGAYA
jgi:hypothetical protein